MGSPYVNISNEQMIEDFKSQFRKISRCSSTKYNKFREKGIPTWECVARRLGVNTWLEVCDLTGMPSIASRTNNLPLDVYSFSDTEIRLMEIEIKYAELLRNNK